MSKIFLMRWNPAISSYKLEVYHRNCEEFPDGFRIDWSIWDYSEANDGDCFVMMRVGDYKAGIVFYGVFVSNPYQDEDWGGTDKKRHYVLMDCFGFNENDDPILNSTELNDLIPEIDWMQGHSGVVLGEETSKKLISLLQNKIDNFSFLPAYCYDHDSFEGSERLPELVEQFSDYGPSIHSKKEEGFDWLDSDEDWCRCLMIPNPHDSKYDIEIETQGEFILYFRGSHAHYENDEEGFKALKTTVTKILNNEECAYSCKYEGWDWCGGIARLHSTEEDVREFLLEDEEYFVRMLGEYIKKDVRGDGILSIDLRFFDPALDKRFSFRLDELTDKVEEYRKRQEEVRRLYCD